MAAHTGKHHNQHIAEVGLEIFDNSDFDDQFDEIHGGSAVAHNKNGPEAKG